MSPRIITTPTRRPISIRSLDWSARYDDGVADQRQWDVGWGPTENAAVVNLIENYPRPDVFCPERDGHGRGCAQ